MPRVAIPLMERIELIPFSTCWYWTGSRLPKGYGTVRHGRKVKKAHRVSYEMHKGPIPNGMHVLHICDEPSCVNPSHLFLGTNEDNVRDKMAKGRGVNPTGEAHGRTKITDAQVCEIRGKLSSGQMGVRIAAEYGISRSLVSKIHVGKNRSAV